jgi:dinuclear metal center YbgI/SA1388 family protein
MKIREICTFLDNAIPLSYQEDYDNAGLQVGDRDADTSSALLTIDVTEEVINEAVANKCGLIISHHPLIFSPLKKIIGSNAVERMIEKAIKNNLAIYSAHTNLDVIGNGVSRKMAEKLSLGNVRVLSPQTGRLLKLVTFVPEDHIEKVREAVFAAGGGVIGNYDNCSFNAGGYGTFRGNEKTSPFVGEKGKMHTEKEIRFETILLSHNKDNVIKALLSVHPYEEVAYDLYQLENLYYGAGPGCIGELPSPVTGTDLLLRLAGVFGASGIRFSAIPDKMITTVALCGGAGVSLLSEAIRSGADAFVTGDVKYHDFFRAEGRILLADIGHFESEKFTVDILYDLIIKKFPTFALRFSETNTNPINYL